MIWLQSVMNVKSIDGHDKSWNFYLVLWITQRLFTIFMTTGNTHSTELPVFIGKNYAIRYEMQ